MCRQQSLCDSRMALSRTSLATFAFGLQVRRGSSKYGCGQGLDIGPYNCRSLKSRGTSVENKDWLDSIEEKLADSP